MPLQDLTLGYSKYVCTNTVASRFLPLLKDASEARHITGELSNANLRLCGGIHADWCISKIQSNKLTQDELGARHTDVWECCAWWLTLEFRLEGFQLPRSGVLGLLNAHACDLHMHIAS